MTDTHTNITKDTHGELFEVSVRGLISRMFMLREVEPTPEEKDVIFGRVEELDLRTLGEIAFKLGFSLQLSMVKTESEE